MRGVCLVRQVCTGVLTAVVLLALAALCGCQAWPGEAGEEAEERAAATTTNVPTGADRGALRRRALARRGGND